MSEKSASTNMFLAKRTKISLVIFAIMAAFAVLARGTAYFYSITATDVVYMNTVLPVICDYVSRFADVAQMFIGYAVVTYYIVFGGIKKAILPFILSAAASLINYVAVGVLTVIESSAIEILPFVLYLLANYSTEFLRLVIISAIAFVSVKAVRGENRLDIKRFSPFATPFNFVAFLASLIVFFGKAAVELINYTLPFFDYYDDVTAYEVSTIVITYLLIAVIGALGYFIAHLTTNLIARAAGVSAVAHNDTDK